MNSIENLRDYVLTAPSICSTTRAILVGYIDGIERDVADMVPLPVDADGVPIHVGDVIAYEDNTKPKEVVALVPPSVVMVEDGPRYADMCRHHHVPTVEDVLREFAQEMNENLGMYTGEAIDADEWRDADAKTIAEYAAKLTLRGDE